MAVTVPNTNALAIATKLCMYVCVCVCFQPNTTQREEVTLVEPQQGIVATHRAYVALKSALKSAACMSLSNHVTTTYAGPASLQRGAAGGSTKGHKL